MMVRSRDGLNLKVSESGEGTPVMLVHGFGGSSKAWGEPALSGLARRHRILAVDLHGHGASDDPVGAARLGLEPVLDDLERVMDAAGVGSCPWIGYSMGGRLTLAASLLRPERVRLMVLESASPGLASYHERRVRRRSDETLAQRIMDEGVDSWVAAWERSPLFAGRRSLDPVVRDAFIAVRRANRPGSLAAWLRALGVGSQPSFWGRLPEVRAAALMVTGAGDPKYSELARLMALQIPGARHVVVPGAGHTVHLEAPRAWVDEVVAFLDE
jgi:2-succinyl-6-hydroxy-2,4-cyclohexadiene-1-carboxylate synthase